MVQGTSRLMKAGVTSHWRLVKIGKAVSALTDCFNRRSDTASYLKPVTCADGGFGSWLCEKKASDQATWRQVRCTPNRVGFIENWIAIVSPDQSEWRRGRWWQMPNEPRRCADWASCLRPSNLFTRLERM